jgi:hypothetical protein
MCQLQPEDEDYRIFDEALEQLNEQEGVMRRRMPIGMFSREHFGSIFEETKLRTDQRIQGFRSSRGLIRSMPSIVFDYTDGFTLDAVAFRDESGRPVIAWSAWSIVAIYQTMFRLLSNPDVLQDIGDPGLERTDLPFIPLSLDFRDAIEHLTRAGLTMRNYLPVDRTRELVARVLARLAVDFIIAHEFRHHQAGHVAYWGDVSSFTSMRELQGDLGSPDLAMISQALEMDADCYGIKTILQNVLQMIEKPDECSDAWRIAVPDAGRAVFLCVLAPYIVFRLCDMAGQVPDSWESQRHPPPLLRAMMLQATMLECLKRWARADLLGKLPDILPGVIEVGERQLGGLANSPPNKDALLKAVGPVGQRHVVRILETWAAIEAPLNEFSYVSLRESTANA